MKIRIGRRRRIQFTDKKHPKRGMNCIVRDRSSLFYYDVRSFYRFESCKRTGRDFVWISWISQSDHFHRWLCTGIPLLQRGRNLQDNADIWCRDQWICFGQLCGFVHSGSSLIVFEIVNFLNMVLYSSPYKVSR